MHSSGSNIKAILDVVRQQLDETAVNAKFSDSELVQRYLPYALSAVWGRLNHDADNPIFLTFKVTVSSSTTHYELPPSIREVHGLVQLDAQGIITNESLPTSNAHHDRRGRAWSLEGRMLRIQPNSIPNGDWYVLYVPDETTHPHYATDGTLVDASTLTLSASPALGLVDRMTNGYVGATLRVIPASGPIEERIIDAQTWTGSEWRVTVRTPFVSNTSGAITYEIAPGLSSSMVWALAYSMITTIATARQSTQKQMGYFMRDYAVALKTLTDRFANMQARTGKSFYLMDWANRGV